MRHTRAEDYTAGELNEPFAVVPSSRWVEGSQWHALTHLGSRWGERDARYPTEKWREWFRKVVAGGGVPGGSSVSRRIEACPWSGPRSRSPSP